MNLKGSEEVYVAGFEERKSEGEMMQISYTLRNWNECFFSV